MRNRLFSGSKFNLDIKVSENPTLDIDYIVNTSTRPNIGWHVGSRIHFYPGLTYVNGKKGDLFDLRHMNVEANVFSTFFNRFLISTGVGLERYVRSEEFFDPTKNSLRLDQAFAQFRFLRDTYNREHFPTAGASFEVRGKYAVGRKLKLVATDSISSINDDNAMVRLQATKAFSFWKKVTPVLGFEAGYTRRAENNYLQRFYLGRSLANEWSHVEMAGLRYMELPVSSYIAGQFKLQIEPATEFFTSLLFNYVDYTLETLRVDEGVVTNEVITERDNLYGVGIELGMLTRLGPAAFTTEYNVNGKRFNFSLHIGHTF
nr:hypothetical protein [uncultured bacterium]